MTLPRTTLAEIREQGIEALVSALGPVGMARFLQQFEMGGGDYTHDRQNWLKDLTVRDVVRAIKAQREGEAEVEREERGVRSEE